MSSQSKSFFKKLLSSVLSAACLVSGTAVVSTAVGTAVSSANITAEAAVSDVPAFSWDNATMYYLLTDRFCNGLDSNDHSYGRGLDQNDNIAEYSTEAAFQGGDFAGIQSKIIDGYFDDLGVNVICISAPYEQIHGYLVGGIGDPSYPCWAYDGYYALDYTETDKNFGTEDDFMNMVNTAHEHGIRVVMNVVMNHPGYNDLQTMSEYGFGSLSEGWDSYYYTYQNVNNNSYHQFVDYTDSTAWAKWWGADWVRSGLPGYTEGSGNVTGSLMGLPDFKTDSAQEVDIPPVLKTKWINEYGTWLGGEKIEKYTGTGTVREYLVKWLTEWVETYGIDGFRCDAAKFVDMESWAALKEAGVNALNTWRFEHDAPGADWTDDFWMAGESFGHTAQKSNYFTSGKFDSMVNFEFAPNTNASNIPQAASVDSVYARYAGAVNTDNKFNVISYLASDDTTLIPGDRNYAGSFLLMMPGGVQIYYGDETNRPLAEVSSDSTPGAGHVYRSFMNWDSIDQDVLSHWQKLGQFRNNHLSVGAGSHQEISAYSADTGYTFARTYQNNDTEDKIVATLFAPENTDITIDVSGVFDDGVKVSNFYDDTEQTVSNGTVTFNSGDNGTILLEEQTKTKGKVIVTHVNAETEEVFKTETVYGIVGEIGTAEPIDIEGYVFDHISGDIDTTDSTFEFSEEEKHVTLYYVFDSENYSYVKLTFVDAATGEYIDDPEILISSKGTTLYIEPKDIENYEADLNQSDGPEIYIWDGETVGVRFVYHRVESYIKVHYYNANGWTNVYMYAYVGDGPSAEQLLGPWPGKLMESESEGWYVCEIPDRENEKVIFASGLGSQEPGHARPGYLISGETWMKNGEPQSISKVNVLYVTDDSQTLDTIVLSGLEGDEYNTTPINFEGYELVSNSDNTSGTFGSENITVTYTYKAIAPEEFENTSELSSDNIKLGESFTVNASAQGGTGDYQYAVLYKLSTRSKWTTAQAYSDNSTITITPVTAGTYDVCVKAADGSGTEAKRFFTVTAAEEVFENTSSVSASSVEQDETITITCSTSDADGSYKYALYKKGANDSDFVLVNDFADTESMTVVMSDAGACQLRVDAKSALGKVVSKTFDITVNAPVSNELKNTSTLSAESIKDGESVTVNASAEGGAGGYQYAVLYKLSTRSKWTTAQAYNENDTITFAPASAGIYDVCIKAKDSAGTEDKIFTAVTVVGGLVNTSKLASDRVSLGDAVTVNASAKGGAGSYKYAVLYKLKTRSKWTTAQAYAANTPVSFTPAVDGAYDVCIKVKDADGTEEKLFLGFVVDDSFKNTSALSETTITVGSSVTVLCSAAGSGDTYLYAVSYKKSTDEGWTELQSFNSNSSVEFAPASSGSYSIYVEASDANGDIVGTVLELEVNDAAPLENKSFTDAAIYDLGVNVSIIGEAAGGTGGYKYMALYKLSTRSRWTTVQQYSDDNVMVFSPSSAGIYNICVKIKDSRGVEVKKFIDIEVVDNSLKNYSCISANKIESGENILVIANAAGSTGFYRYTVSYKKETAGKWIIKQDNKANQFVAIEPDETGVYDVCVKVTDNTGKSARKYFKVEVTEPQDALCNTSSVSETEIVLGEYVIVMASASGSTGFYQYSVYYKAESDDSWTSLSQYSPNGYVIFKPESAGNYEVCVNVKDDEESEETKIFNISVSDNNEICFYDN